jgi:transposase
MELDFEKAAPKPKTLEESYLSIEALWECCRVLKPEILELKKKVDCLSKENAELKERLNQNSNNSSKPPSSDIKKQKKRSNKSGRKPGGQLGHVGVSRKLVPVDKVTKVISCSAPAKCSDCDVLLLPLDKVIRHQVYEIPLPRYEITEYRLLQGYCRGCKRTYCGKTPPEVGKRGFGVRAHAAIALLTSKFKLSKRQGLALLNDFFAMPVCVGSISNVEERVSECVESVHKEIKTKLDEAKVAHIDETGFKQNNRSGWAWLIANEKFSFLQLDLQGERRLLNA